MLHTDDDFLTAITAQPTDRTLRLVYADWLDERADPRAELVRVEEEMRDLPVFGDRFWELKPRRNELRALAGAEWCGRLRYGTECAPVFRHGIPDGWRERWRLIREFTERWHRVPMPDIGGRQAEIAEAEARLGRKLPPSVREWIAFAHDARGIPRIDGIVGSVYFASELTGYPAVSLNFDEFTEGHWGVQFDDCLQSDPPVHYFRQEYYNDIPLECVPFTEPHFAPQPVSQWALDGLITSLRRPEEMRRFDVANPATLYPELDRLLSPRVRVGVWTLIEVDNFLLECSESLDQTRHTVCITQARPVAREEMPEILAGIWNWPFSTLT